MNELISTKDLVTKARKAGVDFGKGDPYNRLRYYTKIGWLPHMERKDGKGHFPAEALDSLLLIEKLKARGLTNEEISQQLGRKQDLSAVQNVLKSPHTRVRLATYLSLVMLFIILANELEIINLGKPKSQVFTQDFDPMYKQIFDSGTAFVPKGKTQVFVKTYNMQNTYKVYVTFNGNISPASRFWIGDKKPTEGFELILDAPVMDNAEFSWWVSN